MRSSWSELVGEKAKPPEEQVKTSKAKGLAEKVRKAKGAQTVPTATAPASPPAEPQPVPAGVTVPPLQHEAAGHSGSPPPQGEPPKQGSLL